MALSDHEKRMLQEMEAALMTEDPRLVSAFSGGISQDKRSRIGIAFALVVLGLAVLFGGLIAKTTPIGVLGFVIALAGLILAISSISKPAVGASKPARSLSARLEERWDERNNQ